MDRDQPPSAPADTGSLSLDPESQRIEDQKDPSVNQIEESVHPVQLVGPHTFSSQPGNAHSDPDGAEKLPPAANAGGAEVRTLSSATGQLEIGA